MTAHGEMFNGPVHRDWFGLASFTPGDRFLRYSGTLYLLDEVGSTNDFLRGLGEPAVGRVCRWDQWGWQARESGLIQPVRDPGPGTIVAARRQTAGHGRQGRTWLDCGGLNLSVVIPPHRMSPGTGFSVWLGLMTVQVVRETLRIDVRLKWPNDLIVHGRKLGGILLQRQVLADTSVTVAGLGLNLGTPVGGFPRELQGRATSVLAEIGREVKPALVAGALVNRVEHELDRFSVRGWEPYRQDLANLDCLLGKTVRVMAVGQEHSGRACGLDNHGCLLLETPAGRRLTIQAGDVHVLETDAAEPEKENR